MCLFALIFSFYTVSFFILFHLISLRRYVDFYFDETGTLLDWHRYGALIKTCNFSQVL